MITSNEYDKLCELTDALREATESLFNAKDTTALMNAARDFVAAENAWEAFTLALVG